MTKTPDYQEDLASIRHAMERSSKFISLSGLSGVLAGVYALAGAWLSHMLIRDHYENNDTRPYWNEPAIFWQLVLIALAVLVLSIVTSYWLTMRKAKSRNENVWNPVSR